MNEIRIITLSMPTSIRGFIVRSYDGETYYTIVVNGNCTRDVQMETLKHEYGHIRNNDFKSVLDVDQIEALRHISIE